MKKIGCLMLICFCTLSIWAQEDIANQKKEINKVKKSNQYIYAEATMPTQEEAVLLAEEILYSNINQWVAEQKKMNSAAKLVVTNTKQMWGNIELPRGNMFRAFFYVKKSDIIPVDNSNVIDNPNPKVTSSDEMNAADDAYIIPDVVKEVASLSDFKALENCLKQLKAEGKVTDFNKYASLKEKDAYYLIIYNRDGKIEAVLSKGPSRINVNSGKADGVENYPGRGAIGFSVVE